MEQNFAEENANLAPESEEATVPKKGFFGVKKEKPPLGTPDEEYCKRLLKFGDFYFKFIASLGLIVVLSLFVAIYAYLSVGFAAIFFVCVLYVTFTSDEMYKLLGLRYKTVIGGISVQRAQARYGEVFFLPARLMWLDVTEISDGAFRSVKNESLAAVYLPETLEKIGEDVFADCTMLKTLYFEGSEEKWGKIESKSDFSSLEIVYNASYPALPPKTEKTKK